MSRSLRIALLNSALLVSALAPGCDSGSSATTSREGRDEREMQPALGKNPQEELARIKKATKSAAQPAPGRAPGR